MRKHEASTAQLLLLAALMLLAGAGISWVAGKPSAWREGYHRAIDDLQCKPVPPRDKAPQNLRAIPPEWRNA